VDRPSVKVVSERSRGARGYVNGAGWCWCCWLVGMGNETGDIDEGVVLRDCLRDCLIIWRELDIEDGFRIERGKSRDPDHAVMFVFCEYPSDD